MSSEEKDLLRALYFFFRIYADVAGKVTNLEREHPTAFRAVITMTSPRSRDRTQLGISFFKAIKEMDEEEVGLFVKTVGEIARIEWSEFLSLPLEEKLRLGGRLNKVVKILERYL